MIRGYHKSRRPGGCRHKLLFALALLFLGVSNEGVIAQSNSNTAANTQAAAASPTPEPTPIPISAIVSEAESVTARLRQARSAFAESAEIREIRDQLPGTAERIETDESESLSVLAANPSLEQIRALDAEWQALERRLASWKSAVQERTAAVDKTITQLNDSLQVWRLTLDSIDNPPASANRANVAPSLQDNGLPPDLVQRINETIAAIEDTRRDAQERRAKLLSIQSQSSELEGRASSVRDEIRKVRARTLTNLLSRDAPPIWAQQGRIGSPALLFNDGVNSLSAQTAELREYAAGKTERFVLHGIVFLLITAGLYWARGRVHPFVEKEPKLEKAARIFSIPIATGLILSIILSGWFYPQSPQLLTSIIGAAALVPVVFLLRQMVDRPLFIILNALVVFYFVDLLRDVLANQPFTARIVFLAEMLGGIVFLTWFLKSKKLSSGVEASHYRIFEIIRKVVPFVLAIFVFAFIASVLGFVSLANLVGDGVLGGAYLAFVIYTAVQIIRGIIIFALRVPPLSGTLVVKNNRPIIRERSVRIVRWLAFIVWLLITLNLFSIREPILHFFRDLFSWSATVGTITFSLGSIVLFFVMVWIAVLISRFLRFVLEEDIYPRVGLGGGVSYAVSTMLHYAILVVGFLIAVGVLGVDFTKFALIAGAVGIGIGFGLQNIINNFVSGLILLVERPVKVDDTVQIGEHTGSLKQIGLRASVLRKVDGSDVIVPNSQLISDEVINWTMSDEKRRIDIPVGVAYGTMPKTVVDLLTPIAAKYTEVLQDPPPRVLFVGLGESSMDFELRVWTGHTEGWVGLRSDLMTEVYNVLTEARVEIPFPQRDLNIRNIDAIAAEQLRRPDGKTPDRQP